MEIFFAVLLGLLIIAGMCSPFVAAFFLFEEWVESFWQGIAVVVAGVLVFAGFLAWGISLINGASNPADHCAAGTVYRTHTTYVPMVVGKVVTVSPSTEWWCEAK